MLNHYCAITRVDYKEFRQCLEKEQSALRSNARTQHANVKCFIILSLMLTMTMAHIQSIVDILQRHFARVITRCQQVCHKQLNAVKNLRFIEMQIKLITILEQYNKRIDKETKDVNQILLYSVETIVHHRHDLISNQIDHKCSHCLEQRSPLRQTNYKSIKDMKTRTYFQQHHLATHTNANQKSEIVKNFKKLYTVSRSHQHHLYHHHVNNFQMKYLKLNSFNCIPYYIKKYFTFSLRLNYILTFLYRKVLNISLISKSSKLHLRTRLLNHWLI